MAVTQPQRKKPWYRQKVKTEDLVLGVALGSLANAAHLEWQDRRPPPISRAAIAQIKRSAESLYPQIKAPGTDIYNLYPNWGGDGMTSKWTRYDPRKGPQFLIYAKQGRGIPGQKPYQKPYRFFSRPEIVAHELGHAVFHAKKKRSLLAMKSWRLGSKLPYVLGASLIAGGLMARFNESPWRKKLSERTRKRIFTGALLGAPAVAQSKKLSKRTKKAIFTGAILAPLAIAAPTLVDEALASIRGMKILRHTLKQNKGKLWLTPGAKPPTAQDIARQRPVDARSAKPFTAQDLSRSRRRLLQAFGTYAAVPAIAMGEVKLGTDLAQGRL